MKTIAWGNAHRLKRFCCAANLLWALVTNASASVTFQPFHHFYGPSASSSNPPLIQATDGNLYGTIALGGAFGYGYVFKVDTNGVFTVMHAFTGGSDGGAPQAALLQANDGNLYGTTADGGLNYLGTVFRLSTNGALTTLYSFTGAGDGGTPETALVQTEDGNLYGAASSGHQLYDFATLFRITTNGALTTLTNSPSYLGGSPIPHLILANDGNLLGSIFGTYDPGEIFRLTTNGQYQTLYAFSFTATGAFPQSVVQLTDGAIYGALSSGGIGWGGIYRIDSGGDFTNLYSFPQGSAYPDSGLIFGSDGNLYGVTSGYMGQGEIFQVTTNGALTEITQFLGGNDGSWGSALVQGTNGYLFGTTAAGGAGNRGTVFSVNTNSEPGNFITLCSLPSENVGEFPDGAMPTDGLTQAPDGTLYGSTASGGLDNAGVVYRLNTNGGFSVLYSFTNGSDASGPSVMTCAADGNLYGTTPVGGSSGKGTIFRVTTNGILNSLWSFNGTNDGAVPLHGLIQANDGNFYGTTSAGGASNVGVIFQFATNGTLIPIYSFTNGDDGADPVGLIQGNDGTLYGIAYSGGTGSNGTLFQISLNGTLRIVHSFTGGNDGYQPWGPSLMIANGNVYGTTAYGGSSTNKAGTLFRLSPDGTFTTLRSFTGGADGNNPSGLAQGSDGNIYGTTDYTVFQITTNGSFNLIHTFTFSGSDGGLPFGSLLSASDGNIYGTTEEGGGESGFGTVFRIVITPSGPQIPAFQAPILSGGNLSFNFLAASNQNYTIQQTTNLASTNWTLFTNLTGAGATVQLSVPATNSAQFFRLRQP